MCLTKIEYESGAILIPFSVFQSGLPDDVDLGAVQNKLSYDDLKKCGERMKNHVGANYKIRIGLLILAFLFVIMVPTSIALFADPRARSLPWMTFVFFVAAMLCYICYGANAVTIERKLKQLIEKENQEIWNSKGLYWEYAKHRNGCKGSSTTYLELRVLSVAMDYRAPGQFQYSFQGTIPNPYMQQQQGNYMPYLELTNYGQQNQAIYGQQQQPQYQPTYGQQQPQFQPTYGQQPQPYQGYPATNSYVGQPTSS